MGMNVPYIVFYSGFVAMYTAWLRSLALALTHGACPRSMTAQFAKEVS